MGAAASANDSLTQKQTLLNFEHDGFSASFSKIDVDGSGEIDKAEFSEAAKELGVIADPAEIDALFLKFDSDNSGTISNAEFLLFVREMVEKENLSVETPDDTSTIMPLLGPQESGSGFKRAMAVLAVNPDAAKVKSGSGYLPLHTLLMQSVNPGDTASRAAVAAAAAAAASAKPLIKLLLKVNPDGAQERVMVGMQYPLGHLPLFLALQRGWDADVVKSIADAYPDALQICDPLKEEKKPPKAINLKKVRFARKIAEEASADDAVLKLLPKPTKKKKDIIWVAGAECDLPPAEKEGKKKEKKGK